MTTTIESVQQPATTDAAEPDRSVSAFEDPCGETGEACDWVSEDQVRDDVVAWDLYCANCFRYRDWAKEPLAELWVTTAHDR